MMLVTPSRLTTFVAAAAVSLFALGCGGNDDGDGVTPTVDAAASTPDAMATVPDAAVVDEDNYLGLSCPENECTVTGSICLTVETTPTLGHCSIPCGESAILSLPPADGDARCAAIYDQAVGTPACGIVIDSRVEDGGTIYTWACAIDCSADDQCPGADLSCQDFNFDDRFCLR